MTQFPVERDDPSPAASGDAELPGRRVAYDGAWDETSERVDWRRYLQAVRRFKWWILVAVFTGTAGGIAVARLLPLEYVAQATIWIETTSRAEDERGPIRPSQLLRSYAWVDLLKSFEVVENVVREMRLYVRWADPADSALFANFSLQERFAPGRYRLRVLDGGRFQLESRGGVLQQGFVGDPVGQRAGFVWLPDPAALRPERSVAFRVIPPREAAEDLLERLRTRMDQNGYFLRVELSGPDRYRVTAVLNALADRYVEVAARLKAVKLEEYTRILEEQLHAAEAELRRAEAELEDFRVRTVTLPSEPATPVAPGLQMTRDPVFNRFFEMRVEQEQLRRDREAIERALAAASDSGISVAALEAIPSVRGYTELTQALQTLAQRRADLRALQNRYTEAHPEVARLAAEVSALEHRTVPALSRTLLSEIGAREQELERLLRSASAELRQIPPRAIEEARLSRRVRTAEDLFVELRGRYEEARLAAASSIPDIRILDRAAVPQRPTNEKMIPRIILIAFLGSLGASLVGAVLLDRVDPRLRYPEQVTADLGLPILGAVPHLAKPNGRLGGEARVSEVIEAFRTIRLNLTHAYGTAGPLVVTVSSPGPGDGKSFISSNLALAFADMGHRTLLIDGDTRRGRLHEAFGVHRKPGLTDYLSASTPLGEAFQKTRYSGIYLIASGTRRRRGPELLGSATMLELITELRTRFQVIIVDTPPLGAGADAYALATMTGNLILVLRTGSTDRQLAEARLHLVDRLPVRMLGAILNDVPRGGVYTYYTYLPGYEPEEETPALPGSA